MTQLLDSTRNYLKTSTRLGRRMSNYKLEAASSQSSVNEKTLTQKHFSNNTTIGTANNSLSSHKRLSGLFNTDGCTKKNNSFSEDQLPPTGPGSAIHQTKTSPNTQDTIVPDDNSIINDADHRRRNSKSSEGTRRSRKSDKSHQSSYDGTLNSNNNRNSRHHHHRDRDHTSAHMEHEVPRGRSPTLSTSNTVSTAASYNTRPSTAINTTDPASPRLGQGQSHVWRRNLLEESIMYSLKLGYAERRRSSSRHRSSRSSKSDSPRTRKAREQALLAAATGRDILNPVPEPVGRHAFDVETLHEEILDRSFTPTPLSGHTGTRQHHQKQQQQQPQQKATFRREKNSPYQMEYNASMTNITHTFATFTLELPEHQVSNIITCSAIPDLFKIKTTMSGVQEQRPSRSRRNSRTLSIGGGISPSPRVLNGGTTTAGRSATAPQHQGAGFHVEKLAEEEDADEVDSPVSPTTATWYQTVFASLDEAVKPKQTAPASRSPSVKATAV
ncbi:hypothetical protein BGZ96_005547 [Linnemannia gamsii]|uniref:Uncharacterized protein n=1 Tax=Linnemannia gamsii TaxID=64522 RepID=A0ABQ7K3U6_9FUNG|nr:hypothetical protein BGZ96_005547 [Linnemannia gamsii]